MRTISTACLAMCHVGVQQLPSYTPPTSAEQQQGAAQDGLPNYNQPPPNFSQTNNISSNQQPVAPGLTAAPAVSPAVWMHSPPGPAATAASGNPGSAGPLPEVGGGGSSTSQRNFFDSLLAPQLSATASGATLDDELPPLPTYIGTTVAQGDAIGQLHGTIVSNSSNNFVQLENCETTVPQTLTMRMQPEDSALWCEQARAPCGVVLQIENRTKQILTLRSCALNTAEAGPRWQIPPPSGVESEAIACFGATSSSAAEVGGRFTLVDAARHSYHLEFGTSSGGTTGGGSARGKVTLEAVSLHFPLYFQQSIVL